VSVIATHTGRLIAVADPIVEEVDFDVVAWSLAHTNRYTGNALTPISVGLHTLIGLDLAPEALRPWWLLHDAPESRIGDMARPVRAALLTVAETVAPDAARHVAQALDELERRHARVIHAAAGLPLPSLAQRTMIASIDLRCLATERRDFFPSDCADWPGLDGVAPARTVRRFLAPDRVADQLAARFRLHLPALRHAA
jgi:hypothetical protein